jgi:hypothetical protein
MNRKGLAIGLAGLILLLGVGVFLCQTWSLKEFRAGPVAFKYPRGYIEQPLAKPELNQAVMLLKLKLEKPSALIVFVKESDAAKGANILKTDFLDFLEKNAERVFPSIYPGYQKLKTERVEVSGRRASVISFSYTGTDKKTVVYIDFLIIPLNPDAYYLTIQSPDREKLDADAGKIRATLTID